MARWASLGLAAVLLAAGCGGEYILTVPDALAPTDGKAAVICRLRRTEIWRVPLPVHDAAVRFIGPDGRDRAAYTDAQGYAGATLAAPNEAGAYPVQVSHDDPQQGDSVSVASRLYAWDARRPAVAVDLRSLANLGSREVVAARASLVRLAAGANLLYLTRSDAGALGGIHDGLRSRGYPDGPVLLWQAQRWHLERDERTGMYRVIIESRLVSPLEQLRRDFPGLTRGIAGSAEAANAFAGAGMQVVRVGGPAGGGPEGITACKSWMTFPQ